MCFFNLPKIGNLYYVNTESDQLQYVNNHISASQIPHFFLKFEDVITS